ncbi:MAG TPA: hypothetical protein PKI32_03785 [Opitutales bacterium]|nr:hypothetical protein [Opitutales bacterium]
MSGIAQNTFPAGMCVEWMAHASEFRLSSLHELPSQDKSIVWRLPKVTLPEFERPAEDVSQLLSHQRDQADRLRASRGYSPHEALSQANADESSGFDNPDQLFNRAAGSPIRTRFRKPHRTESTRIRPREPDAGVFLRNDDGHPDKNCLCAASVMDS